MHVVMCMYGGPLEIIQYLYLYGRSLIEAHLFGSMEKDEECDYDYMLKDESNLLNKVVRRKFVVLEMTMQDVFMETKLMHS